MLPLVLILVRHGESEGNYWRHTLKRALDKVPPEFIKRPDWQHRLTPTGVNQARSAGQWIKENIPGLFDLYLSSLLIRAQETAAELDLPNARWQTNIYLTEALTGLENLGADKYMDFEDEIHQYEKNPLFWQPPNGESLMAACFRVNHIIQPLLAGNMQRVIAVNHEKVIWAFRFLLERINPLELPEKMKRQKVHNGGIVQYTRINPEQPDDIHDEYGWVRVICPHDQSESHDWEEIKSNGYTTEELLKLTQRIPRLIKEDAFLK